MGLISLAAGLLLAFWVISGGIEPSADIKWRGNTYTYPECRKFTMDYLGITDTNISNLVCDRLMFLGVCDENFENLPHEVRKLFVLPRGAVKEMCDRMMDFEPDQVPSKLKFYAIKTFVDICEYEGAFPHIKAVSIKE